MDARGGFSKFSALPDLNFICVPQGGYSKSLALPDFNFISVVPTPLRSSPFKNFLGLYSIGETPNLVEVDNLLDLIEKYALASHLVWGLWGIISERVNDIDFNYMEYAKQRFQQYWSRKSAT